MRTRIGTRTDGEAFALEDDLRIRQRAADHFEPGHELRVALLQRNTKSAELERAESRPHPDGHPAFAQVIDPTDLLGQPQRMVQGDHRDAVADTDPFCSLRDAGGVDRGYADRAVAGEVVLGYPNTLEAVPLREVDLPQRLLDDRAVRWGTPAREELEDANVHRGCDLCGSVSPQARKNGDDSQFSEFTTDNTDPMQDEIVYRRAPAFSDP